MREKHRFSLDKTSLKLATFYIKFKVLFMLSLAYKFKSCESVFERTDTNLSLLIKSVSYSYKNRLEVRRRRTL